MVAHKLLPPAHVILGEGHALRWGRVPRYARWRGGLSLNLGKLVPRKPVGSIRRVNFLFGRAELGLRVIISSLDGLVGVLRLEVYLVRTVDLSRSGGRTPMMGHCLTDTLVQVGDGGSDGVLRRFHGRAGAELNGFHGT